MKHCCIFILSCVFFAQAQAQKPTGLQVKGVFYQGNVLLRWIPTDFALWQKGNQYGYRVVRQLSAINGVAVANNERIASTKTFWGPYRPLAEPLWAPMSDTSDLAAVAAGALYSEDFEVVPGTPGADEVYQAVNTNEKNENRFGFGLFAADQSFPVSQAMGLALIDAGAAQNPSASYTYRVVLLMPDSLNRPVGFGEVNLAQPLSLPAPAGLRVEMAVGRAALYVPRGELETHYTNFNIERSGDGGATYVRRNAKPLLFLTDNEFTTEMVFSDTVEEENKVYRYRLRGASPFGMQGPPSNVVVATSARKKLEVYPVIQTVVEQNGGFLLAWDFPAAHEADLEEFRVLRSTDSEGGYVVLAGGTLDPALREFTDPSPSPRSNYYKVVAIQQGGYELESISKLAQLNDTEAPAVPTGLSADVDAKGLVTLTWSANTELDLKGYRVFLSTSPDGDFAPINAEVVTQTTFKHQLPLNVLTRKAYFTILATDLRENDSNYAPAVEAMRPDIMRPAKPVLAKVEPLPTGVQLEWVASQSEDVVRHEVQRRADGSQEWATLATFPRASTTNKMLDTTTQGVGIYHYRVLAVDGSGLPASSSIIEAKPTRNNLAAPANLKANSALDGAQKMAKLSWEYPLADQLREFQIYRSLGSDASRLYATVKVDKETAVVDPVTKKANFFYKDTDIQTQNSYRYQVLAKYQDGSSSPQSGAVQFQY